MPVTPVLYDAECRFCRTVLAVVLAWDRQHRLRPVALQSDEAERLLPGIAPETRLASMHVVPATGPAASGGAALSPLLELLPGGAALGMLAARFPNAAAVGYSVVADNRGRLSKLVPMGMSARTDALVARRSQESI